MLPPPNPARSPYFREMRNVTINRENELVRAFEIRAYEIFCSVFARILGWEDRLAGPPKDSELEVRLCRLTDWAVAHTVRQEGVGTSTRPVLDRWTSHLQEMVVGFRPALQAYLGKGTLRVADWFRCTEPTFFAFYEAWELAGKPTPEEVQLSAKEPKFNCPWCNSFSAPKLSSVTRHVGAVHPTHREEWKKLKREEQYLDESPSVALSRWGIPKGAAVPRML